MMTEIHIDREAWHWVQRPTLMLHAAKARRNLADMVTKAARLGLRLRPHFKTHQSQVIGRWFREEGISSITVSSIEMAQYFAADGWKDITIAFPINVRAIDAINSLAQHIRLGILVSDPAVLPQLERGLQFPVHTWIEIDSGDGRSGIKSDKLADIQHIANHLLNHPMMPLQGLLGHAGHTYRSRGSEQVEAAHKAELDKLRYAHANLLASLPEGTLLELSTGDTPACSISEDYQGVTEIRPGNFIYYDLQQVQIGSCTEAQVAIALACPVVAIYPERLQAVVHGGGVHFAKDILQDEDAGPIYGKAVLPRQDGWTRSIDGCYLKSISQEHGVLQCSSSLLEQLKVGDLIGILPVHSCMTADLMTTLCLADVGMELPSLRMMKAY